MQPSILDKILSDNIIGNITIIDFLVNLFVALILSLLVGFIYSRYGKSISNRKEFSSNFPLLAMTTMFIITIVKSSLALSLGLVGALSIVRFRSAIKEPEELTFIFLSMAIGLGLGANQVRTTIIATIVISLFIFTRYWITKNKRNQYLNLLITIPKSKNDYFDKIIDTLSIYCDGINLRRLSEENNTLETCMQIDIHSIDQMRKLQKVLSSQFPGISIDFLDSSGI